MSKAGAGVTALAVAGLCGIASASHSAEPWAADDGKCGEQPNTLAIVACVDAREKTWDSRLNQAWKAINATLRSDPDSAKLTPSLKAAQLAWLKYRDANCAYYDAQPGTFARVQFANCMLDMTQARAIELQADGPH